MMTSTSQPRDGERFRAYLAGAIEHAPDGGTGWRRELTPELDRLGHSYYDATRVECSLLTSEEKRNFAAWKRDEPERFRRLMRKIIDHDLSELLERADYVIAYWDEWTKFGGGTHGEITCAYRAGLPVYLVSPLPRMEISGWILGCCEAVFEDLASLVGYLVDTYGKG